MMKIENGEEEKQKLKGILKEQIIPLLDQLGMKEGQARFLSERWYFQNWLFFATFDIKFQALHFFS